jgi:small ubiquitin-related modifier
MVSPVPAVRKKEESIKRVIRVVTVPAAAAVAIKPVMLVTLKVQDTSRRVVERTMRRTDKLQGIMDHYYDVVLCTAADAGARGAGRFIFDGKRVKGEHTPEDLNMVTGDQIDFFHDLLSG